MIRSFIQQMQQQITSKEARHYVSEEVEQHLLHSKAAYMQQGEEADVAEMKAVRDMGSSIQLGKSMNRLHKPKVDWLLIGLVLMALCIGFIPVMLTDDSALFIDKLIHTFVAVAIIILLYFADYRVIWKGRWMLFVLLMTAFLIFSVMKDMTIDEYGVLTVFGTFMISNELFMPFFIIAWAAVLTIKLPPLKRVIGCFVITTCLVLIETSVMVCLTYISVTLIMIISSKFSRDQKMLVTGVAIVAVCTILYKTSFIYSVRMSTFLNPERYADGSGYLTLLIEDIVRSAGWFGMQQSLTIPDDVGDFALLNVLQHFGYSGVIGVTLLLGGVLLKLLWNARTIKQPFGRMLVQGAALYYGINLLFSVLALVGFSAFFNMYTPFLSFGFESLVVNAILIGIVLSVYRRKSFEERMKPYEPKPYKQPVPLFEDNSRVGKFLQWFFYIE